MGWFHHNHSGADESVTSASSSATSRRNHLTEDSHGTNQRGSRSKSPRDRAQASDHNHHSKNSGKKMTPDGGDLSEKEIIEELWKVYDKDHNARIDRDEFIKFMDDVCAMVDKKMTHHEYERLFRIADTDHSGFLSKQQFA